jgi:hypothetical protein
MASSIIVIESIRFAVFEDAIGLIQGVATQQIGGLDGAPVDAQLAGKSVRDPDTKAFI